MGRETILYYYEGLATEISRDLGLPLSLDHHYKFLVLLPQEGEAGYGRTVEAMTRYFGIEYCGEVLTRGIEARRHDTPRFLKEFEVELIHTLFSRETVEEVRREGYDACLELITREIERVMTGSLELQDLVVSKILRKPLRDYKALFPHVTAGLRLAAAGKLVKAGDHIDFVFQDADHANPLSRTVPALQLRGGGKVEYDREKYRSLLLDAAETVLGTLGFSRKEAYGYEGGESLDWVRELYDERRREAMHEANYEERRPRSL